MQLHRKATFPKTILVACSLGLLATSLTNGGCNSGQEIVPDSGGTGGAASPGAGGNSVVPQGGISTAGTANTPLAGTTGTPTAGSLSIGGTTAVAGASSGGGGVGGLMMGGAAGTTPTGGSGGAADNLTDAVKGWMGWRFEMPCASYPGGEPLDDNCTRDNICWVGTDSVAPYKTSKDITMGGDPTKVYEFQLHARGVIEPKVHSGCQRLTQPIYAGGIAICKGGGDSQSGFNLWSINIDDPPQVYWMDDSDTDTHRTDVLDGTFTVQARGQTKVVFKFDDKNTGEINNGCPAFRKVIAGVPPFPGYYTGNFFQLDIVDGSVKVAP